MVPTVVELKLQGEYSFMYENFLISGQQEVILLLKAQGEQISVLKFSPLQYRYGYPNDEGGHPLAKYGLGFYGIFEVTNSPWLQEINLQNQSHPSHSSSLYKDYRHIICRFKDVTFEVLSKTIEEVVITREELFALIQKEVSFLQDEGV